MKTRAKQKPIKTKVNKTKLALFENDTFIYFLFGVAVLIVLIARIHLLAFPFERDEGEYAYMAKLILDGHAPYTLAYNMKLPGTYFMYAIIMGIFGKSIVGVHVGLTIITLASMFIVFSIAGNFFSKVGALIATVSSGILGTSWTLLAQSAHATHFVTFFALLGIYVLLQLYKSEKNKLLKYFISGVFFSLAFICKQSGLFFVLFGLTVIIVKEFNPKSLLNLIKKLSIFTLGFVVPVAIMLCYFYFFGDFDKFWFWTVKYLSKYGNQVPLADAPRMFKMGLSDITASYTSEGYIALWIVALIGIPLIFIHKGPTQNKIILFSFLFFSFLTTIPGFYFRHHYFIPLIPAVALLIAVFFEFINNYIINTLKKPNLLFGSFMVFLILLGTGVNANIDYLFKVNPNTACKIIYGKSPFVESIRIGKFLEQNTTKDDKIAVLGSEPQICFYANRTSASGYIYTYGLVELHPYALTMQKEMIHEIELNNPKYLLFVDITSSWVTRSKSERYIFTWAVEYINKNYRMVGLLDILPDKISSLKIGDELNNYTPKSKDIIYIYEKIAKN